MGLCSRCGGDFPDDKLTTVLDGYATGGAGYVEKHMCKKCVKEFMQGKRGLQIGGSDDSPKDNDTGAGAAGCVFFLGLAVFLVLIWWRPLGYLAVWPKIGLSVAAFFVSFSLGLGMQAIVRKFSR
ncbi:MAG: hypothetical protein JW909_07525 [Planctomycetes bacterium]|nr:hypothetical protein [Planctomycetota bacterium]